MNRFGVWYCSLSYLLIVSDKKYEGELFLMYLFGYGLGRFWIEGLRTDQLLLPGVGIAVSQLLAGAIVVGTGAAMLYLRKKHKNS